MTEFIPVQTQVSGLLERLAGWRRWLRFQRAFDGLWIGLNAGLAIGLALGWAGLWSESLLPSHYRTLILLSASGGALIGALAAALHPRTTIRDARLLDRRLGLKERLSTVLEHPALEWKSTLEPRLWLDAAAHSAPIRIQNAMPLRASPRLILLSFALLSLAISPALWAQSRFEAAQQQAALESQIESQREQLAEALQRIEQDPTLDPLARSELAEPLEQALQALEQAESREAALAALLEAEQALRALASQDDLARAEQLQSFGERLSQQNDDPLESFGEALSQDDFDAAADALRSIDPENLDSEQAQQLSQSLQSSAEALAQTDPALSEDLSEAASNIEEGDAAAAAQALEQAAAQLDQIDAETERAQAAEALADELAQQAAGFQAGDGEGLAQAGDGESAADGQGSSSENGAGASSGAGTGSVAPGQTQGDETDGDFATQNDAGEGGLAPFEPLAPSRMEGEGDQALLLPSGEPSPGDLILRYDEALPSDGPGVLVPYQDLLPGYRDQIPAALDRLQPPTRLESLIRDYFSSLEP